MSEPGALLASGRSADVFEAGPRRVVRRRRNGPIPDHEPIAMQHARAGGFPVPEIDRVDGHDMVLERVDGPDLLTEVVARPWRAGVVGRELAALHRGLAAIAPPPELRTLVEPVESVVHGDLHPGNVLRTDAGPVVIDWEGAGAGPRDADAAITWLLLSVADVDDVPLAIRPIARLLRWRLRRSFLAGLPRPRRTTVADVCDRRLADPNTRAAEAGRIRRFRARHG